MRKYKYDKWIKKHRVKDVNLGDYIDARDTEHIWCRGKVEKIISSSGNKIYYIHYDGWSRYYDEYITQSSERIAPLGLYTSRKDIPKYSNCET